MYVNIANRAALMYSFAGLLLAVLASLSAFPDAVNVVAVALPQFFFGFAMVGYVTLGLRNTTDNQFRNPANHKGGTHADARADWRASGCACCVPEFQQAPRLRRRG